MSVNDHLHQVPKTKVAKARPSTNQMLRVIAAVDERVPRNRLLDMYKTMDRTGFGRSFLYEQIALNKFPRPIKMGTGRRGAIRFSEAEIDAWVQAQIASRDEIKSA